MQNEQALPQITLSIWLIRLGVIGVAVAFLLLFRGFTAASISVAVFLCLFSIFLSFWHKSYKFNVNKDFLTVCYGLFFRTTCILPFDKVIYMKIYKTPLDRAFNLSFAILKTVKGFLVVPEIADNNILLLKKFVNGDICE